MEDLLDWMRDSGEFDSGPENKVEPETLRVATASIFDESENEPKWRDESENDWSFGSEVQRPLEISAVRLELVESEPEAQ